MKERGCRFQVLGSVGYGVVWISGKGLQLSDQGRIMYGNSSREVRASHGTGSSECRMA